MELATPVRFEGPVQTTNWKRGLFGVDVRLKDGVFLTRPEGWDDEGYEPDWRNVDPEVVAVDIAIAKALAYGFMVSEDV